MTLTWHHCDIDILPFQLRDLEAELEAEQRRSRELAAANRKLERQLAELRVTADDDRRMCVELSEQVNIFTIKIKQLRKQLEEAVSIWSLGYIQQLGHG